MICGLIHDEYCRFAFVYGVLTWHGPGGAVHEGHLELPTSGEGRGSCGATHRWGSAEVVRDRL